MDSLTTEPNILRDMIAPPSIVSKMLSVVTDDSSIVSDTLPGAMSTCVPWRTTQLKHANNDVYVNFVKEMDTIIHSDGVSVKCEAFGGVEMNSHLSGIPDWSLSFANPSILNDLQFHPCSISTLGITTDTFLLPPDGLFKLMSYM